MQNAAMAELGNVPILYSFRRCPYAMRARMAIAISGIRIEHREISLRDKPAEMLEASPKATVPVVVLPDGGVIEESLDVMHWALGQNDPEGWLDGVNDALIAANDGGFKHALDRYKYPYRHDLPDGLAYRVAGFSHLKDMDKQLASKPYFSGYRRGFTDIALFPFVRQFATTDRPWFDTLPLPALQSWLAEMLTSPLFEGIMAKHSLWKS